MMRNSALRSITLLQSSHVASTYVRQFTSTCRTLTYTSFEERGCAYKGGDVIRDGNHSIVWAARSTHDHVNDEKNQGFFTSGYAGTGSSHGRPGPSSERISDHEYEVRVGRAYDLLRATLPEFMRIGLVDYDQQSEGDGSERQSTSLTGMTLLDVLTFRSLRDRASEHDVEHVEAWTRSSSSSTLTSDEQAYHRHIHFRFCAHTSSLNNLTDEEAASLSFNGRSLYFASAQILRHTINILFADSNVTIESIRRERKSTGGASSASKSEANTEGTYVPDTPSSTTGGVRNDTIYVRVGFVGHLRVTGAEHRYTLVFRYDIDEDSGKIVRHTVERIEPEIGRKLWSGLAAVWSRITGHSSPQPIATAVPVTLPRQRMIKSKAV